MISLSVIVATLSVVGILGTAAVVIGGSFRTARSATVLNNYKNLAESYKMTNDQQESQIKALQESDELKDRQIHELRAQVETLTRLVTGRAAFEQLASVMTEMQQQLGAVAEDVTATKALAAQLAARGAS